MGIDRQSLEGLRGIIIFAVNDQEFCSDINNVAAIVKLNEGILSYDGIFLNKVVFEKFAFRVIDIHKLYGLMFSKITDNTRIMLFEMFGKKFGFLIDRAIEILTADKIFVEESLDIVPDTDWYYAGNIFKYNHRKILIPDFEKISRDLNKIDLLKMPPELRKSIF